MWNGTKILTAGRGIGALSLAAAGLLLAGCLVSPSKPPTTPDQVQTINPGQATLITEGEPVFLLPGTLKLPSYYAGDISALSISAERLDGGPFQKVAPAQVAKDGSFKLQGPITSKLFFATADFTYQDNNHRVRALARAQSGDPIVLDTASSLVASKIAIAAQSRFLDETLDYTETTELTAQVRSVLGTSLDKVSLDQPNEALSAQLNTLAKKSDALSARLLKWEDAIDPQPSPSPSSSPAPSTSPSAAPQSSLPPVK